MRPLVDLCAALNSREPDRVRQLLAGSIDWSALQTVSDEHRLTGYLSARLQTSPFQCLVPQEFLYAARRTYLQQWIRNGHLFKEMERIADRLTGEGVPFLFFKGPLMASSLYDQLGSRASWDIDLLIPDARAISRVESALAALGYRRRSRLILPLAIARYGINQMEYANDGFAVEPHWSLQSHPSLGLDTDRMWRERVTHNTPGAALPALSAEYTLLANILSIPVDLQNASLKIRTVFELCLLCERFPEGYDWPAFWTRRRGERTARLSAVALAVASELFAPAEPPWRPSLSPETRVLAADLRAAMLSPGMSEWRRRRLALGLFETPLPRSLVWWAMTLPVRAMAHPKVTSRRLRWW